MLGIVWPSELSASRDYLDHRTDQGGGDVSKQAWEEEQDSVLFLDAS